MSSLTELKQELRNTLKPEKAVTLARFFKTGKGQYGEGDKFLGVVVPDMRKIARRYHDLTQSDLDLLLASPYHEERLVALLILVHNYQKGSEAIKESIYHFYLAHTTCINNWDLVDLSCHYIVGDYLIGKDTSVLSRLAHSENLWERRIAIISTFSFIYKGLPDETFKIADILLHDTHDLIHKAVGWMLREVGKRCSQTVEEQFLEKYYKTMPRTMLRYAIERFPEDLRIKYLKGGI